MAKQLLDEQIRDTDPHEGQQQIEDYDGDVVFHVVNDLDADVTVEFVATHSDDSEYTDGISLTKRTVAAGDRTHETLTDSWERVKVVVTASTQPSNGKATIYFMS